jgi:hypothetical protein
MRFKGDPARALIIAALVLAFGLLVGAGMAALIKPV